MAAHSNRSPSPISSRTTNPNPRISESSTSIRRSFRGNNPFRKSSVLTNPIPLDPTTPANSPSDFASRRPSDFASRRSMGIERTASHLRDCKEKENGEKNTIVKASKLQSSICKNFMAPTISAASKFTPSPRKKVLVERNDPVRTSIALPDGKPLFFSAMRNDSEKPEPKTEMGVMASGLADSENKAVHDSYPASRPFKKVVNVPSYSQHSKESVIIDSDGSKMESNSIAPLDADPTLPPYDPYLSEMPQFIHKKPNPKVGLPLSKEEWLDPNDSLIAGFMSESFPNSDEGSVESHREEMEVAVASADMVIGADDQEVKASVPESFPVCSSPAQEGYDQNNIKKPRMSLSRLLCFSMIMVLLIATCVPIAPSFDEFAIKDLSFSHLAKAYQQSRVAGSARLRFGRLAQHVNRASSSSASLVLSLINSLGKGEKRTPVEFMNPSDLQENPWNVGSFPNIVVNLEPAESVEDDIYAEMDYAFEKDKYTEDEVDMNNDLLQAFEGQEAYACSDVDNDEISTDSVDLAESEFEYLQDVQSGKELKSDDQKTELETEYFQAFEEQEAYASTDVDDDETSPESVEIGGSESQYLQDFQSEKGLKSDDQETEAETQISQETNMSAEDSFLAGYAVGMTSLFAGLLAVAAFIHKFNKKHPSSSNVARVEKQTQYEHQEKETENVVTDDRESYSFQESSSSSTYSMREANEVQSSERKEARKYSKRESLASSSYGSFTSYARIPIKSNGNADEEILTPVRRSSRIRNVHATTTD